MRTTPKEPARFDHWRRPGRLDHRLSALLMLSEARIEALGAAYIERLETLLAPEAFARLMEAWAEERETPPDIAPLLADDAEAERLYGAYWERAWVLFLAVCGGVPSEHYWYRETGRVKPPRSWSG